jgi:hypothetical protein
VSEDNDFILPPLTAGAAALHENMISFVEAGFTRQESLQIVIALLIEAVRETSRKQDP